MIEDKISPIIEGENLVLKEYYANVYSKQDFRMAQYFGPFDSEKKAREKANEICVTNQSIGFEHAIMKMTGVGNTGLDYYLWVDEQSIPFNLKIETKRFEFDLTGLENNYLTGSAGGEVVLYTFKKDIGIYISNGGINYGDKDEFQKFKKENHGREEMHKDGLIARFNLNPEKVLGSMQFYYTFDERWHKADPKNVRMYSSDIPGLVAEKVGLLLVGNIKNAGYEVRQTSSQFSSGGDPKKWEKIGVKISQRRYS